MEQELDLAATGSPREPSPPIPTLPDRPPSERLSDEIGDLLFAVVNLARKAGVQPGLALDRANRKFRDRFEAVERSAPSAGSRWIPRGWRCWMGCGTK